MAHRHPPGRRTKTSVTIRRRERLAAPLAPVGAMSRGTTATSPYTRRVQQLEIHLRMCQVSRRDEREELFASDRATLGPDQRPVGLGEGADPLGVVGDDRMPPPQQRSEQALCRCVHASSIISVAPSS